MYENYTVERDGEPTFAVHVTYFVEITTDAMFEVCKTLEGESKWSTFFKTRVLPLVREDFGAAFTVTDVNSYVDGDGSWEPNHPGSGNMRLFFEVTLVMCRL